MKIISTPNLQLLQVYNVNQPCLKPQSMYIELVSPKVSIPDCRFLGFKHLLNHHRGEAPRVLQVITSTSYCYQFLSSLDFQFLRRVSAVTWTTLTAPGLTLFQH
jgi:hypothetical protein